MQIRIEFRFRVVTRFPSFNKVILFCVDFLVDSSACIQTFSMQRLQSVSIM